MRVNLIFYNLFFTSFRGISVSELRPSLSILNENGYKQRQKYIKGT